MEYSSRKEGDADTPRPNRLVVLDRWLDRFTTVIARCCIGVVALMLLTMLVAVTVQVVSRYWLHNIVGGPEEIARLSMVIMVFLALPALARYSEHIRLDLVNEKISNPVLLEWIARAALLVELVFLAVLAVLSYEFVSTLWQSEQQSPALGLRIFWSRLPVLVGTALAALVCACLLLRRFLNPPGTLAAASESSPDVNSAI